MPQVAHTFGNDDLARLDATATATLVQQGEQNAEEVIQAAVQRARAVQDDIHAIVTNSFDVAIQQSSSPTPGPFQGVPTFIKDMNDVVGLPTKFGTEALDDVPPATKTDPYIQQMFDMGMISLGKSTMPEFGFTPSTEFPNWPATRNPWNVKYSVGGSSGGAGALVAAGVVPIAHAADGAGSIRIPAAACGLVGLKSTRGRLLPSVHTKSQIVSIVVEGVLTRSVRDTALYYAEAEKRYSNRKLEPIGDVQPVFRRLKIAAVSTSPTSGDLDEVTQCEFEKSVGLLNGLGHKVIPSSFPTNEQLKTDFIRYWSFLAFAMAKGGSLLIDSSFDRQRVTNFSRDLAKNFLPSLPKFPASVYRLRRSEWIAADFFRDFDILLTPTMGHATPQIGYFSNDLPMEELFTRSQRWACFTPFANATGIPAISLPLGYDSATNLPIGMMFAAAKGQERLLLELALEIEEASPFRKIQDSALDFA